MIKKITAYFNQLYPYEYNIKRSLLKIFGFGFFVFGFLMIFQPFGLREIESRIQDRIILEYSALSLIILTLNILILPKLIPGFFIENKWNVKKEICFISWNIFTIGLCNSLYASFLRGNDLSIGMVINFLILTFSIGIIPVTIMVVLNQNRLLKQYLDKAEEINKKIHSSEYLTKKDKTRDQIISLNSETGRDVLQIGLDDLLFLKSAENYVEVYWNDVTGIRTALLRSTLKRIENELEVYKSIFRCHRKYLVNIKKIDRITGNSQGYRLIYRDVKQRIPVSRSKGKRLCELIA
jgi:hypothetical protein